MTNPFDWKNQPAKINMRDLATAQKNSYQQTAVINRRRAKGEEPSIFYSAKGMDSNPQKFAMRMPVMPMHPTTIAKKKDHER